MSPTLLATYNLGVVTLLLIPGLAVALITTTVSQHGYRRAFLTLISTNGAFLVLITLAALMLAGMVLVSVIWPDVLGPVGSLYIGVMAANGLWVRSSDPKLCMPKRNNSRLIHEFLTGVADPKDILLSTTFFPQFITTTQDFTTSALAPALAWVIFDAAVLSFYIIVLKR